MISQNDIYIRLSDDKFVKVHNGGEDTDQEVLSRYEDKDIHELYLEKHQFLIFIKSAIRALKMNISADSLAALNKVRTFMHSEVKNLNFDESLVNEVDEVIDDVLGEISEDDQLKSVIETVIGDYDDIVKCAY